MSLFCSVLLLNFLLGFFKGYDTILAQKSPKLLADCVKWITTGLTTFGIKGVDVKTLVKHLKTLTGNTNAAVRTAAVGTLGVLRQLLGPGNINTGFALHY